MSDRSSWCAGTLSSKKTDFWHPHSSVYRCLTDRQHWGREAVTASADNFTCQACSRTSHWENTHTHNNRYLSVREVFSGKSLPAVLHVTTRSMQNYIFKQKHSRVVFTRHQLKFPNLSLFYLICMTWFCRTHKTLFWRILVTKQHWTSLTFMNTKPPSHFSK